MIVAELNFIRKHMAEVSGVVLDVGSSGTAFRRRERMPYDLSMILPARCKLVNFDVKSELGVNIVGDAERLSEYFPASSVGAVVCTSLLEHVRRPWVIAEQCAKVLAPKGMAVFTAPWVYEDHPDPIDCWRISVEGMRALAGLWFNEIECVKHVDSTYKITMTMYAGRRR